MGKMSFSNFDAVSEQRSRRCADFGTLWERLSP
jgi:hypothetical protein